MLRWSSKLLRVAPLLALVLLAACEKKEVVRPAPPPPPPPIEVTFHRDVPSAIAFLTKSLGQQLVNTPRPAQNVVPVEEFFSAQSAEVTSSGRELQRLLAAALSQNMAPLNFVPLDINSANNAQWALLANYAVPAANESLQPGKWLRLQVAMVESSTGKVLTRINTYLDSAAFNAEPTQFFKDAPMYFTDGRHRDRVGAMYGESRTLNEVLALQSELANAVTAYEGNRYAEAEQGFTNIRKVAVNHPTALTGLYQTYWRTGRKAEAEQVFSELVAAGIDAGSLSVKLLFKVGGTAFVDSADLPIQYRLWMKSVGQVVASKNKCVDVTGHASKSGSPEYNDRLSLQRAESIVTLISQTSRDARQRFKSAGRGYQETIVGTGANDATDAIDRRVEFKVRDCAAN